MRANLGDFVKLAVVLATAATAWACASGGGITGTSVVVGPISELGSIFVNGIEFDTTNAEVTVDGDPATAADLELGMIVVVRGRIHDDGLTGDAERIGSDHVLFGPVEAVNAGGGTFVAMSQLVITDAATVFDGVTLDALVPGDVVEIFGVVDAAVSIRATREKKQDECHAFEHTSTITSTSARAMRAGSRASSTGMALISKPVNGQ